jgi:hypothetical protein
LVPLITDFDLICCELLIKVKIVSLLILYLGRMCIKFQLDPIRVGETTAGQTKICLFLPPEAKKVNTFIAERSVLAVWTLPLLAVGGPLTFSRI